MNQATLDFIRQHQDEDVRQLAFLGSKHPEVDLPFALDQIRGRKMARGKLPRWAGIDGIVYPPHISMEQCSSEQTAGYKAELAARLLNLKGFKICEFAAKDADALKFAKNEGGYSEKNLGKIEFVDLTGGFGVDFSYIAARLGVKSMYVERQEHLCEVARENFERLGLKNAIVRNGDGVETLRSLGSSQTLEGKAEAESHLQLIFIDPARRDDAGNKVVSLKDCTPDITQMQDEMLEKADYVIIKLSPMLDWHRAVNELKNVREVHIISVGNECKELLLVLSSKEIISSKDAFSAKTSEGEGDATDSLLVYCVNDDQSFVFDEDHESSLPKLAIADEIAAHQYLYEPNASLMKAGCFGALYARYGAKMLAQNSHLFVSEKPVEDFPGRAFRIRTVSSFNKKELKRNLAGITKANIATRNFPISVAELRKRLKLKDGGDVYIFATTLADDSHVLFICDKQ